MLVASMQRLNISQVSEAALLGGPLSSEACSGLPALPSSFLLQQGWLKGVAWSMQRQSTCGCTSARLAARHSAFRSSTPLLQQQAAAQVTCAVTASALSDSRSWTRARQH